MEFSGVAVPLVAKYFAVFFAVSFGLLLMIMCAGIPAVFRSVRREVRFAVIRRRRTERMLADRAQLDRDSKELEGVYSFDS